MSKTFEDYKLKGARTRHRQRRQQVFNDFYQYTKVDGGRVTLEAAEEYLQNYVARVKGSTKSVRAAIAMAKRECTLRGLDWLSDADADSLKATLAQYTLEDNTPGFQKRPLQMRHILAMTARLAKHHKGNLKIKWAFFDGAFRIGEVLRDTPQTMFSDLSYNPSDRSYTLNIGKTKTDRREAVLVTLPWREGPCAARLMPKYLKLFGINKHVDVEQDGPLFPGMTKSKWRAIIKSQVQQIGLDPALYSGHSFRAGWATDMFNSQVPYYAIKKVGRWRSDAALLYYRDSQGARAITTGALDKLHRTLRPRAVVGGV